MIIEKVNLDLRAILELGLNLISNFQIKILQRKHLAKI